MVENKSSAEKLTKFHKIMNALQNIQVKHDDEKTTLPLLSLLPRSF